MDPEYTNTPLTYPYPKDPRPTMPPWPKLNISIDEDRLISCRQSIDRMNRALKEDSDQKELEANTRMFVLGHFNEELLLLL